VSVADFYLAFESFFLSFCQFFLFRVLNPNGLIELSNVSSLFSVSVSVPRLSSSFREIL
jgi:hypothetical protein